MATTGQIVLQDSIADWYFYTGMFTSQKYKPGELLKDYVMVYWSTTGQATNDVMIVPDAYPELIFNFDRGFRVSIDNKTFSGIQGGIFGQFERSCHFHTRKGDHTLWVKLYPWTPGFLFPFPFHELNNRVSSGHELGDKEFLQLIRNVTSCGSIPKAIRMIEAFLIRRIYKEHRKDFLVMSATRAILQNPWLPVDELAERYCVTTRYMEKKFKNEVGIPPSFYRKQIRTRHAANLLANYGVTNLASFAYEQGYTDQSHFIREFKSIALHTPAVFKKMIEQHQAISLDPQK